jgi:sugar-specific transcriptional regulator TrmB
MDDGELVGQLSRLGLTSYEAKAYLSLIKRDSFTAAQVARQAALPRQRIYDVLASLVQKGLAVARPGTVVKYSATPPEIAINMLVQAHRQELLEMEQGGRAMVEYIEVLRDRRAINERFAELQAQVKNEILVFTKPPYATPPQENVEGLDVSRTHEARAVYEFGVFDDPEVAEGVRQFIEAGEDARFVPELPLKLVIIDETIVMFGMEDPVAGSNDITIVVVEHSSLARVLKTAFNAIWAGGLTFAQAYDKVVTRSVHSA